MFYKTNKKADLFRFISISFTVLTVCALYTQNKNWVIKEDWSALMDVVPSMSGALWVLVIVPILYTYKKKIIYANYEHNLL